jgi:hypothetical protein
MYKPTSYFQVEVGAGNKLFGFRNNTLNALQTDNKLIFTPSAGYFHKSGFGINAMSYLMYDQNKIRSYQYSLSPSFDYSTGKTFGATISYTHYFIPDKYDPSASPIQHDVYAGVILKRYWLKPGVYGNFSAGNYDEVVNIDTTFTKENQTIRIQFVDTIRAKLELYAVTGSVEHTFKYYNIFSDRDAFNLTTQLLVNMTYSNYKVSHNSTTTNYNTFVKKKRKRTFNTVESENSSQSDKLTFNAQSAGVNLVASYLTGNFYVSPGVYLDYYIPDTDFKKFTKIINLAIGYRF